MLASFLEGSARAARQAANAANDFVESMQKQIGDTMDGRQSVLEQFGLASPNVPQGVQQPIDNYGATGAAQSAVAPATAGQQTSESIALDQNVPQPSATAVGQENRRDNVQRRLNFATE